MKSWYSKSSNNKIPLNNIIFYDGDCAFCNFWVGFVLRNMTSRKFYFSSLHSDFSRTFLNDYDIDCKAVSTIYFLENKRLHIKSTAVLKICKGLKFPYRIISFFQFLPKKFSDFIYDNVAKNRHILIQDKKDCELYENKYSEFFLK